MMSAWHLLWIVPSAALFGFFWAALLGASSTADVTPINGKNRWEIIRRYAQQGTSCR